MSGDPGTSTQPPALATGYEQAAERLGATIALAVEPGSGFAAQVEAALRAALGFLAAEPALAYLLVVRPFAGDPDALAGYERWQRCCAESLRAAAAEDPDAYAHPPFFEPALVSDLCAQVARCLAADPAGLEGLLPDLLELIHACYFGPERAARLVDV